MTSSYWFTPRPKESEHQHPFLVFDGSDRLHLPLTRFGKEACARVSHKTIQVYLYALLPFFTYLETDTWQIRMGLHWNDPPARIRQALEDYLIQKLQCKVQPHRDGWKYVMLTAGTRSSLRIFLAAVKLFYQIMRYLGDYTYPNPLIDSMCFRYCNSDPFDSDKIA